MAESLWVEGPQSTNFFLSSYPASSPTAILLFVHGFIEHVGRYEDIFPLWTKRGVTVLAFDQRGFGRTATDKLHKSSSSSYSKTSSYDQHQDVEFFISWTTQRYPELPLFLMGHSMGGGIVLGFPTRPIPPPSPQTISQITGIIATSPLLRQATPAPKWKRSLGGVVSHILPWGKVPSEVDSSALSHDEQINKAYKEDPLVIMHGTIKGVGDMLNLGESILAKDYERWPVDLPVLIIHGTEDKVTSYKASEEFISKLKAEDKSFIPYQGGYHELHNEPNGVREKLVDECVQWVLERAAKKSASQGEDAVGISTASGTASARL